MKKILMVFSISLLLSLSLNAQQLGLFEEPGGGGGSTTTQSSVDNDNTTLYLVGGAVLTGIVIYALLQRNKKKKNEVEDSSKAVSDLINLQSNQPTGLAYEMQKAKDEIPVDLFLGSRRNFANSSERTYIMGLSFRF